VSDALTVRFWYMRRMGPLTAAHRTRKNSPPISDTSVAVTTSCEVTTTSLMGGGGGGGAPAEGEGAAMGWRCATAYHNSRSPDHRPLAGPGFELRHKLTPGRANKICHLRVARDLWCC
jgi:hypothetical protein